MFSLLGKVFQPVANAVARIGTAAAAVGRAAFTAGAATGANSMASGGLNGFIQSLTGNGVLGSVLTGAVSQAAVGAGIGAITGAVTGIGAGKGALYGAAGGAVTGGLSGATRGLGPVQAANTPTGMAPIGQTQSTPRGLAIGTQYNAAGFRTQPAAGQISTVVQPQQPQRGLGTMFGRLFQNEHLGSALESAGAAALGYMGEQSAEQGRMDRLEREIQHREDTEQRRRDSYSVDPSALHGPVTSRSNASPSPGQRFVRPQRFARFNPQSGLIELGGAA